MDAEIYSRQELVGACPPSAAIVVGCGGTGTWTALILAMTGTRWLALVDHDAIEPSNLARLPLPQSAVGRLKVEAVRDEIIRLRPECVVLTFTGRLVSDKQLEIITAAAQIEGHDNPFLFECTDSDECQKLVWKYATERGIPCFGVHYDGGWRGSVNHAPPAKWDFGGTGYQVVPSWAPGAVIPAAFAVASAEMPEAEGGGTISLDLKRIIEAGRRGEGWKP